ncbi:hypothetical protein BDQ17DRAFT_1259686 [Cyathus striatus]|nr:hypothetical protein BDQ17DRAFT_1259686 [Cyathus striatus]
MQLITEHIVLNKYLHRIGKVAPLMCEKCNMNSPELVDHFLLQCPAFATEGPPYSHNVPTSDETSPCASFSPILRTTQCSLAMSMQQDTSSRHSELYLSGDRHRIMKISS